MGDTVQPYIYPPPSLLVFWPLAYFSLQQARAIFVVFSHLCFLGSIWLMLFKLTGFSRQQQLREIATAGSLVYLLSADAVPATLGLGQINMAALFFICLALAALRGKRAPWQIALPLAVSIVLKTYPVFLLPILLFRKQFRALAFTLLFFVGFAVLAYVVLPHNVWSTWVQYGLPAGAYGSDVVHAGYAFNQSINAFAMRLFSENYFSKAPLFHPFLAQPVAAVCALIVMGVTVFSSFCLLRLRNREQSGGDEISAYLLMIYLIAPISWDHHVVLIFPACVWAIGLISSGLVRGLSASVVAAALFLIAWKLPIASPAITSGWWTLLISGKFYAVLALWMFFVWRLRRVSQNGSLFEELAGGEASD